MRPSVLLRADIADCVTGFVGASFFRSAGVDDSELCRDPENVRMKCQVRPATARRLVFAHRCSPSGL
ncbi:hypothetical protein RER_pREL1-00700 (plasmid) [Rhodococcus erythropolis PR4]|uniref:Uncharacterized protein n=1 Tax=Rhodococcus erythropolis (strain PR4 / NBRC 100887) TaxID=234621 RepID=Q3L9V0_RHOE4|nr:hypothetical protein RHOER0001_6612 [Rhodococcus erythropolis SK121]BAE46013.1 hypothetical protein RER_pREL1-00700 [Rhodococcus erythropolis PR4]